jgi:hypothetical protein
LKSDASANGKKMRGQKNEIELGRGFLGEGCEDYLVQVDVHPHDGMQIDMSEQPPGVSFKLAE